MKKEKERKERKHNNKRERREKREITTITKEKKIKSKLLSAMMEKNRKKQPSPLKKYNRIVSLLVKDLKKRKEDYDIKDIRLQASQTYKEVRELPLKQINLKKVKEKAKKGVSEKAGEEITAVDVPDYWFNDQPKFTYWFQVGEWANQFANAYPNIPIMLITKATESNPLVVKGATGDYDGSVFQMWTEGIRSSLDDPNKSDAEVGQFVGTPAYKTKKGDIYAVWYETGVKIPKVPPKPTEIEPRKKKLIEEAEEKEKERFEIEKPKKKRGRPKKGEEKKPLPKPTDKKPTKKPTKPKKEEKKPIEKEKPTGDRVKEIRGLIADFRQDVKDGIISKEDYKELVKELTSKLEKGGKV
jgi:hypothetical protein